MPLEVILQRTMSSVKVIDRRNQTRIMKAEDAPVEVRSAPWEVEQNGRFLRGFTSRDEARAYARIVRIGEEAGVGGLLGELAP
jgi:hypothetical protein